MTVNEIIEQWLKDNHYDGLYFEGECACVVGDLAPCSQINGECEAGYKVLVCGEHDWHIQGEKV